MADFRPFDYNQAIGGGTRNALLQMQTVAAGRQIRERNVLDKLYKQAAATGEDLPTLVEKAGMPEKANQLRSMAIERGIKGMQYIAKRAPVVHDQASLSKFSDDLVRLQLAQPGEIPTEWNPETANYLAMLSGNAKDVLERFGPVQQIPGAPEGTVGQQSMKSGKWDIVQKGGKAENLITVLYPDGKKTRSFRKDDPALDEAIKSGATVFSQAVQSADVSGLTGKTKGTIEVKIVDIGDSIARIEGIQKRFKPEYLEYGTRFGAAAAKFGEKAGFNLSKKDRKLASDFYKFKRRAIENINLDIKRITGAQMSEAEADRIRQGMPDPGEGIFGGDSPTEFKAKMDDTLVALKAAKKRYEYLRSQGITKITPEVAQQYPLSQFMEQSASVGQAPPAAIQYLQQNDSPELRQQFQQKYGYLPEGF